MTDVIDGSHAPVLAWIAARLRQQASALLVEATAAIRATGAFGAADAAAGASVPSVSTWVTPG